MDDELQTEASKLRALSIELDEPIEVTAARQLLVYRNSLAETREVLEQLTQDAVV